MRSAPPEPPEPRARVPYKIASNVGTNTLSKTASKGQRNCHAFPSFCIVLLKATSCILIVLLLGLSAELSDGVESQSKSANNPH